MYDQLVMMAITTNRKRKRIVLFIKSKLSALDSRVAKGVSYSELSEKFDIGKSTITSLKTMRPRSVGLLPPLKVLLCHQQVGKSCGS